MNRLARYGFKDSEGHPIENCTEWIELIQLVKKLESEGGKQRGNDLKPCTQNANLVPERMEEGGKSGGGGS